MQVRISESSKRPFEILKLRDSWIPGAALEFAARTLYSEYARA